MVSVHWEIADKIGWLWLDNPERHNALDQASWEAIPTALAELLEAKARVVIVAGKGESFCAGADISEFDVVRKDAETAARYEKTNADAFAAIAELPVPTISAINGYCLGGGFGIAAACDLRIATQRASFAVPAAKLGLAYPVAAMRDIVAAVGDQNAKRLLFTAQRFDATSMRDMGFLMEISADALDAAHDTAQDIAELAPFTHRATKAAIDAISTGDSSLAETVGNATFTSADYAEGRSAFKEKRKPEFNGG